MPRRETMESYPNQTEVNRRLDAAIATATTSGRASVILPYYGPVTVVRLAGGQATTTFRLERADRVVSMRQPADQLREEVTHTLTANPTFPNADEQLWATYGTRPLS